MVKKSHDGGKNMNCKKCGNLCNDNDVYCINCGNPLQHQTQKKKKKIFIGIIAVGAIIVAGAIFGIKGYLAKDDLYDTYIYGTWESKYNKVNRNIDDHIEITITFNMDGSVMEETEFFKNGEFAYSNGGVKGRVTNTESINEEIEYIEFDGNYSGSMYKYKNLLGWYCDEIKIPEGKNFDLMIKYNGENYARIYNKDGTYHFCQDYKNCNNNDCGGTTLKYKRKGNYIYCYYNDNTWDRQAFILDNGIFYDTYIKEDE